MKNVRLREFDNVRMKTMERARLTKLNIIQSGRDKTDEAD